MAKRGVRNHLVPAACCALALTIAASLLLLGGVGRAQAATQHKAPTRVLGFYVDWDPASYTTLAAHYRDITVLSPGWLMFQADGTLLHDDPAAETRVNNFIASKHATFALEPLVANWDYATDDWDASALSTTLADPVKREALATSITVEAQAGHWRGVNIDFEALPETSRDDLTAFMRTLYAKAHPLGLEVSQDVNASDPVFDITALGAATDFIVPMFYDQHWDTGSAGPVASQKWFVAELKNVLKKVPASKVVAGIGDYGYNWRRGATPAGDVTCREAFALAKKTKKTIKLDSASLNPTFTYGSHRIWFLDAVTAFNEVSVASKYGVRGYAIWRLGGEDPSLWKVMHRRDSLSRVVARSLGTAKRKIGYSAKRKLIVSERIRP